MHIKTHTFENGFRIIYEKSNNNIPISAVNIICDVGSAYETDNLRGSSHFIEHMCFKGTKNIKKAKELFIEFDKVGSYVNAFTTKRFTSYVFKCESKDLQKLTAIYSDMIMNSVFDKNEYEKEHKVVIEENIKDNNDAEYQIFVDSDKLIYNGSSFEFPVDSYEYHLDKTLLYDDVVEFYKENYIPNRMIFSIVTYISFEKVIKIIEKSKFMSKKKSKTNIFINYNLHPQNDIQFKLTNKRGVDNILLTIGFRTCGNNNEDKYKLEFVSNILCGTMSGRIFMILREKYGLIYSSEIETDYYDENGNFVIFTQTDLHKIIKYKNKKGVIPIIISLLNDLIKNGITQEEFLITKGNIKGNMLIEMEDINNHSEYNGIELLLKKDDLPVILYSQIYKKYFQEMKREDVNNMIKHYFTRERMSVCLLGEKLPTLQSIEKEFHKFLE
jgi:predicted Zn-dependent peptidase